MRAAPDRYAVIGHPVTHSRSPFIHAKFAESTQQSVHYDRIDALPEDFVDVTRAFFADGGRGLNVTVPHKEVAATLVDELSERANLAGAVNTIIPLPDGRLRGDNTDGVGLVTDIEQNIGIRLYALKILIIGAGGATRGVVAPILAQSPSALVVANRTVTRALEIAERFSNRGPITGCGLDALTELGPFDLIINATSASLAGEVVGIPQRCVSAATVAYDMMYHAGGTPFTRQMTTLGAQAAWMGYGMLVEQAAEAFYLWRGVRPPTHAVLKLLSR